MKRYKKFSKKVVKKVSKRLRKFVRQKTKKKYPVIALAVIGTIGIALAGYIYNSGTHAAKTSRLVTFHDRGENRVILTHAKSVKNALKDAGITIAPQDVVEPAIGSELLSTDSAVIIYRSRPVLVIDGSLRQKVVTPAQSPNEIATAAGIAAISDKDKTTFREGSLVNDEASQVLTIERAAPPVDPLANLLKPTANALTISKGAQLFTDSSGVAHRETYYDLPMNIVIGACGGGDYSIRYDGAKIDKDGYVLVAAGYQAYPRCSVVETSMGLGKVYDTGGFALRYPHGFDLATDWTNNNGR